MIRHQTKMQIVVVDSRPHDYAAWSLLEVERPYRFHFLTTARSAMTFIHRASTDLWVINTHLPDMSGFDFYQILRDQINCVPALMVSDEYDAEQERMACKSGVHFYLAKNSDHSVDWRLVHEILESARTARHR